ncbi:MULTISPECIES: response regulator [unclassified Paraburkholderia]|uniref:response regulator n=1 Tax=unclassified Paraburkholderia TaxID=2615204 RepID=UPI000E2895B6|nr:MULTISPECIES: response regulator [unclassified Paraburkholderia]REE23336.1 response regulator receiver domain-containing protein [Paraburkholderia sp. BL27I4N3]RKR37427.1 response regulator receiver domain-containing protein [Paraburkholderia sp. BL17N1]
MSVILIVDDDSDSLWLLQVVLEGRGHHVVLADDGHPALEIASRYLPDVIVTDWNMPCMDGDVLCERLRCYPALALIPIIMTSAQSAPSDRTGLWNIFFRKPVDIELLAATVDSLAAKRLENRSSRPHCGATPLCRWPAEALKYWA